MNVFEQAKKGEVKFDDGPVRGIYLSQLITLPDGTKRRQKLNADGIWEDMELLPEDNPNGK